jgi:hypothetical protein
MISPSGRRNSGVTDQIGPQRKRYIKGYVRRGSLDEGETKQLDVIQIAPFL